MAQLQCVAAQARVCEIGRQRVVASEQRSLCKIHVDEQDLSERPARRGE